MYIETLIKNTKAFIEKHSLRITTLPELEKILSLVSNINTDALKLLSELSPVNLEIHASSSGFVVSKYLLDPKNNLEMLVFQGTSDYPLLGLIVEIENWLANLPQLGDWCSIKKGTVILIDEMVFNGHTSDDKSNRFYLCPILNGKIVEDVKGELRIDRYLPNKEVLEFCNNFYIANPQYLQNTNTSTREGIMAYLADPSEWYLTHR